MSCPIEHCRAPNGALPMCGFHWMMVPAHLRNDLNRASRRHGRGSPEYLRALGAALTAVYARRPD